MDPGKIVMSRGGEDLEKVMGRREEDELPKYEAGAFQIEGEGWKRREDRRLVDQAFVDQYLKHGQVNMHTMRSLVESIQVVPAGELQCDQVRSIYLLHVSKYLCFLLSPRFALWYLKYKLPVLGHLVCLLNKLQTKKRKRKEKSFSILPDT
jgi:glycoprotein 2-beta-D-xylosyltransferase